MKYGAWVVSFAAACGGGGNSPGGVDAGSGADAPPTDVGPPGSTCTPLIVAQDLGIGAATRVRAERGDVDGDGKPDFVIASSAEDGKTGWKLQLVRGVAGGFAAPTPIAGIAPGVVSLGDVDGDGVLDLLWLDATGQTQKLAFHKGHGDGTFAAAVAADTSGLDNNGAPSDLAIADMDGDGKRDVVVGWAGSNDTGGFSILPGNGDGTFGFPTGINAFFGGGYVGVGDLDGNGVLDVATVSVTGDGGDSYVKGGQSAQHPLGSFKGATTVLIADVHADGRGDIIIGGNGKVAIWRRDSGGVYTGLGGAGGVGTTGTIIGQPAVTVGDFNGDGKLEVASSRTLAVLADNNEFFNATRGVQGAAVFAMDVDGDGVLDLVNVGAVISVSRGRGNSTFADGIGFSVGPAAVAGDFDGDGKADIYGFTNQGTGGYQQISIDGAPPVDGALTDFFVNFAPIVAVDADGDGKLDILGASGGEPAFVKGHGDGTFEMPVVASGVSGAVWFADVDGDGALDAIVAGAGNQLGVRRGLAGGAFADATSTIAGPTGTIADIQVGDLDGDGKLDLVVNTTAGAFALHAPGFAVQSVASVPAGAAIAVGDVDGDGRADIVAAAGASVKLVDFDRDGKLDQLIAEPESIGFRRGNGDGTFGATIHYAVGGDSSTPFAVADVDGDGRLDLVRDGAFYNCAP